MVRLLGWQGECQTKKNRGSRVESCGLVRDKRIAYHVTKALKKSEYRKSLHVYTGEQSSTPRNKSGTSK